MRTIAAIADTLRVVGIHQQTVAPLIACLCETDSEQCITRALVNSRCELHSILRMLGARYGVDVLRDDAYDAVVRNFVARAHDLRNIDEDDLQVWCSALAPILVNPDDSNIFFAQHTIKNGADAASEISFPEWQKILTNRAEKMPTR